MDDEAKSAKERLLAIAAFMKLAAEDEGAESCAYFETLESLDGSQLLFVEAYPFGPANHAKTLAAHVWRWACFVNLCVADVEKVLARG